MDAWADGLNYYLHTHPEVEPRVLDRFEPWMALTFSEGASGRHRAGEPARAGGTSTGRGGAAACGGRRAHPPECGRSGSRELARHARPRARAPGLQRHRHRAREHANGNALLLINPHTSFYFRHEAHVVSDEGLNAYGALTWGQFFVYQGFNETAGWMHTSSSGRQHRRVPGDGGGARRRLHYATARRSARWTTREVTVATGRTTAAWRAAFTAYRTHRGPSCARWTGAG
jgi:acyl-homoserine-lactone acylase